MRSIVMGLSLVMTLFFCFSTSAKTEKTDSKSTKKGVAKKMVVFETSHGNIEVELFEDKAKDTVNNFLSYVDEGFYDGTIFHRVINNFMIQGGGFTKEMKQKATKDPVKNEADNGLANERGTLAMARTSDPHSATAQFFINVKDNSFLNHTAKTPSGWGYTVFGKVVGGMDVVDKIKLVETKNSGPYQNVPAEPVVIKKAKRK